MAAVSFVIRGTYEYVACVANIGQSKPARLNEMRSGSRTVLGYLHKMMVQNGFSQVVHQTLARYHWVGMTHGCGDVVWRNCIIHIRVVCPSADRPLPSFSGGCVVTSIRCHEFSSQRGR